MKKIQVFGPGCPNCIKLAEEAETAARELGLAFEMEKISDVAGIMRFGIPATPALAVDGKVLVTGRVPGRDEIRKMLEGSETE